MAGRDWPTRPQTQSEDYSFGQTIASCLGLIAGLFTGGAAGKTDDVVKAVDKVAKSPSVVNTAKKAVDPLDQLLKQTIRDIGGNPDEPLTVVKGWKTGGGGRGFGRVF